MVASPEPAPSFPLAWLELAADYRCNHRCLGCSATDHGPSQSHAQLLSALDQGRREGIEQLWVGGGEPTLRKDLLPLIAAARARGYVRIRLQTNGAMLSYPDVTTRLRDAGVTDLALSIQGPDARMHDRFSRVAGSFERLEAAASHGRSAGLKLEGDVLLYRTTTPLLPEIVRHFFARGIPRYRAWMMAPPTDDPEALAEEPRVAEVAAAVERTLALGLSDDPDHLLSLHTPACVTPIRARFFAAGLGLLIHDASGRRFRLETSSIEGGAYPLACAGCTLRPRCQGLRAAYLARHGDGELRPAR